MKTNLILLILVVAISAGPVRSLTDGSVRQTGIDRGRASEIARDDASKVYRSLEPYTIVVSETRKRWLVKFKLRDGALNGGGPEYVISKKSGKILKKTYWQ
ncbi:MAG: hypothetical protein IT173_06345 [Acidobacteria bacterium]|nr:hypothetical protein [Acidobacteriota bacterium]